MAGRLPLGRKLIKLTVDAPPSDAGPKRGYRRIGWTITGAAITLLDGALAQAGTDNDRPN